MPVIVIGITLFAGAIMYFYARSAASPKREAPPAAKRGDYVRALLHSAFPAIYDAAAAAAGFDPSVEGLVMQVSSDGTMLVMDEHGDSHQCLTAGAFPLPEPELIRMLTEDLTDDDDYDGPDPDAYVARLPQGTRKWIH